MIFKKIIEWLKQKYSDCFFVGNSDALPPPLPADKELEYLIKCKQGDMEARNILIEHNLRLVVFLAKKFDGSGYDLEDLVSIGSLGLIKGIMTYKIDKNIKLDTYSSRCITNEILMYLRKDKKRKGEVSFEDALNYDAEVNELRLEDIMGTEPDVVHDEIEEKFDKILLTKELETLLERDKEIMTLRYGLNNRTHATAAVGGPPHWVSLIEQQGDKFVPSSRLKAGSLSELHYATSGGEAKKETTENAINEALKYCGSDAKLGDGLGATETWASMIINNGKIHHRGTVGEPISTLDVKLVDPDTGKEVKDGEKGLLYVSGPSVMLGYHNNPEEISKVISYDENGKRWINIGDFLMKTPDGEYKYVGRQKRNFVSGCDNIYPEELESLLLIPEIREVVVTPISDEMVQYIPRYHISLYDTNIDYKELEEKINALVMSKLNENWLPGSIAYYDKPLERMQNSKVNISYYKELDQKALENNEIDNTSAKQLRLKRI